MLLVILGAGASYDSLSRIPPPIPMTLNSDHSARLPLVDQHFCDRPKFSDTANLFPQFKHLIPILRKRRPEYSVERQLEELSREAADYPPRRNELMAVRYYIQAVILACENEWKKETRDITNHLTLLSAIQQWRYKNGEEVSIVTFNYDRLIEDALAGIGVPVNVETHPPLMGYITDQNYKLFKLHGSVDWGRYMKLSVNENLPQSDAVRQNIQNDLSLYVSDDFVKLPSSNIPIGHVDGRPVVPAIAIPVENKSAFECPPNHVAALTGALSTVDKLLIIGWRASETAFLDLLKKQLRQKSQIKIVCGNCDAGDATKNNLEKAGIHGTFDLFDGGFTAFIEQLETRSWLQRLTRD